LACSIFFKKYKNNIKNIKECFRFKVLGLSIMPDLTNKKKYVLVVRKEKKTPTIKETSRKKIR
jgi:hypothetical protein